MVTCRRNVKECGVNSNSSDGSNIKSNVIRKQLAGIKVNPVMHLFVVWVCIKATW